MDGTIVEVMESWPLQLAVETSSGLQHLALAEDVRIMRGGVPLDPGSLTAGLQVRVLRQAATGQVVELLVLE